MIWGRASVRRRLEEVDRKLARDDQLVNRLADVVLQLRVATYEAEIVLRRLQELRGEEREPGDRDA